MERFERICSGGTPHQFSTPDTTAEHRCPQCGAPPRDGLADATPAEPLAEVTAGGELWFLNIGALSEFLTLNFLMWWSRWFEEYFTVWHNVVACAALCRGLRNLRPLHWYEAKISLSEEPLRVDLTQAELAEYAEEMASLSAKLDALEERKKEAAARFKAEMEAIHQRLSTLADRVRTGEERLVKVETVLDLKLNLCTRIRKDTSEIILERPLTDSEKQAVLFAQEKHPAKANGDSGEAEEGDGEGNEPAQDGEAAQP